MDTVDILQFDVVAQRLKTEYKVECLFEPVNVATARWVTCDDAKKPAEFRTKTANNLTLNGAGNLAYIAPIRVNIDLTIEHWPDIEFDITREH